MATNLLTAATEQNSVITVVVNGQSLGVFDTSSGGDSTTKAAKHRAGGMGNEVIYASLPTYSALTVGRVLEPARDYELIRALYPLIGRVTASVTEQLLDADGNTSGNPKTWTGSLSGVKPGKTDSNSTNVRMFEIDIDVSTVA